MITKIVVTAGGRAETVSVKDWLSRPLTERISQILAGEVEFFDGARKLTSREALDAIKTLS